VFMDEVVGKNAVVDRPDLVASFDEINEMMGMSFLEQLAKRFSA